jgi:ankyrin repeat protein
MTYLHLAAGSNYATAAKMLLENGANPSVRDLKGRTPLHMAAAGGHTHVAERLLQAGANPSLGDDEDRTPAALAQAADSKPMQELLRRHGASQFALPETLGDEYVPGEAERRLAARVEEARENGVDLDAPIDERGRRLLHVAAERGFRSVVKDLLRIHESNVNVTDDSGRTPLHLAAGSGRHKVVEILAGWQAKIDPRDATGQTPLHMAAAGGHAECVKRLRDWGANPGLTDKQGHTPRQLAFRAGLEPDALGLTRDAETVGAAGEKVKRILESKGPVSGFYDGTGDEAVEDLDPSGEFTGEDLLARARRTVADGKDINARDAAGWTLLHAAAAAGQTEAARYLLENGAEIDAGDVTRRTALHLAAMEGREEVVRLLLERGANRNAQDVTGSTPAQVAAAHGHAGIAQRLR